MSRDLNAYLNRDLPCKCGRTHRFDCGRIEIGEDAMAKLPGFIKEHPQWKNLTLIADRNTWDAAGEKVAKTLEDSGLSVHPVVLEDRELIPDETTLGEVFMKTPKDTDLIIAVGSGTLNDTCKFLSYQMGKDYLIFASAPSMDGFVSSGAALVTDHVKTTYDTHAPVAVFGDTTILSQAPMNMITAGLGDILGKYTCLLDWQMARMINGEYYCDWIHGLVEEAIETVVNNGKRIEKRDPEAIGELMEALVLTGLAMYFTGNSRPASGCEHHLSHYWEMQFQMMGKKPILHGTKVGIGLITAVYLYRKLIGEKPDFEALMEVEPDRDAWEVRVKRCFGEAAPGILALEEKAGKNDPEKRRERLRFYQEHWDEMTKTIDDALPQLDEVEDLMKSLDAPINPHEIELTDELIGDAIVLAKEVRDRFTLLQILWDLNLLDDYAKDAVVYFNEEQKGRPDGQA